jgi:hypothetical protein
LIWKLKFKGRDELRKNLSLVFENTVLLEIGCTE